jgi:hypothetical protein
MKIGATWSRRYQRLAGSRSTPVSRRERLLTWAVIGTVPDPA